MPDRNRGPLENHLNKCDPIGATPAAAPAAAGVGTPGPGRGSATPPAAGPAAPPSAEGVGTWLGPYKLLQPLGQGGMGTVYLAEQERPVRRRVAVKVIKAGLDSAQVLARFETERQTLAVMDHLHIAKVLDVGATEGRQPYFVMELVQGTPLTDYCDAHALPIRQRLELFVMVCHGIQHAHQKGIIHRDIKPSNVLVTLYEGKLVPKVIDFGLAKAMEGLPLDRTPTRHGTVLGTLDYMSPEQAEGNTQKIDTRSDVYSLGVLFYELLTGSPPLDQSRLRNAGVLEILRLIKEEKAPRPSVRLAGSGVRLLTIAERRKTAPARLVKLLHRELDWIALRALEKDRDRRYDSAAALARDVERYLADEPVEACPSSRRYRLGKFARKHRPLLLTGAGFVGLLLVGVAGLIVSNFKINKEVTAKTKALVAEQAALKEALGSLRSASVTIRELIPKLGHFGDSERAFLDDTLKQYERVANLQGDTPQQRQLAAEGLLGAASIHDLLGHHADAETGYRLGIDLYAKLAAQFPSQHSYRDSLATGYNQLGQVLRGQGKRKDAENAFRQSVALRRDLAAEFPQLPDYRQHLAGVFINLGLLSRDQGKPEDARACYDQAGALLQQLTKDAPAVLDYRLDLARCEVDRGIVWSDLGEPAESHKSYARATSLLDHLVKDFPNNPDCRIALADSQLGLGGILNGEGKSAEARKVYEEAIASLNFLVGQFPAVPEHQSRLAGCLNDLGDLFSNLKDAQKALASYRSAINLGKRLIKSYPAAVDCKINLAATYSNYANCLRDHVKPSEAGQDGYRKAILDAYNDAIALLGPLAAQSKSPEVLRILRNAYWDRADALGRFDRHAEAKKSWQQALSLAEAILKLDVPPTAAAVDDYFAARAYALASAEFKDDGGFDGRYVSRALALLEKAKTRGYFQDPRRIEDMNREGDLNSLRGEPAFKKFAAAVGVPARP